MKCDCLFVDIGGIKLSSLFISFLSHKFMQSFVSALTFCVILFVSYSLKNAICNENESIIRYIYISYWPLLLM